MSWIFPFVTYSEKEWSTLTHPTSLIQSQEAILKELDLILLITDLPEDSPESHQSSSITDLIPLLWEERVRGCDCLLWRSQVRRGRDFPEKFSEWKVESSNDLIIVISLHLSFFFFCHFLELFWTYFATLFKRRLPLTSRPFWNLVQPSFHFWKFEAYSLPISCRRRLNVRIHHFQCCSSRSTCCCHSPSWIPSSWYFFQRRQVSFEFVFAYDCSRCRSLWWSRMWKCKSFLKRSRDIQRRGASLRRKWNPQRSEVRRKTYRMLFSRRSSLIMNTAYDSGVS